MYLEFTLLYQHPTATEPDYETSNCLTEYLIPLEIQGDFYLTIFIFRFPKGKVNDIFSVAISKTTTETRRNNVHFAFGVFGHFFSIKNIIIIIFIIIITINYYNYIYILLTSS